MKNLRKNIKQMFWFVAVLFITMGAYFVWFAAYGGRDFIANPFNARVNIEGQGQRGTIYDAHGRVLAESIALGDGLYERVYPFGAAFAHTVGYSGMSRAGLELIENFTLHRLSRELIQMTNNVIFNEPLVGNSIITTFDADIQNHIYNRLSGSRGAAVVLDARTGAVLAMVSAPSFDPGNVAQDWGNLLADSASPLLNRATSGRYPPGSTFKLITALAAFEYDIQLLDFTMHCSGQHIFEDEIMQCAGGTAHGYVDFSRAMAVSCNGYFATLMQLFDNQYLISVSRRAALFNQTIPFALNAVMPQFLMDTEPEIDELIQTAIGQGRTSATPLNMALFTAAIANGGVMPQAYMVTRVVGAFDNTIRQVSPRSFGRVMSSDMAEILAESMFEVVQNGTGTAARRQGLDIAGKTGTAQNETGIDHSWFIGFTQLEEATIALSIIIENTGGGPRATQLAGEIFEMLAEIE